MAQVQYAGGSGVPVLPSNIPGIPQGGYGDPGINPNTNQRAPTPLPGWLADFLATFLEARRQATPPPFRGAPVTPGTVQGAVADTATPSKPGPFCLGADVLICEGAGLADGTCRFVSNLACLFIGLFILLALIGLGVKGILD